MLCGKAHRAYDQLHHAVFNGRSAGCCLRLVTDIEGGNNHQLSNGIRPLDFLDFFGPLYRLSQPKNNKQVNSWIHFQRIFCWFYLVVHSPKASTVEAIRIIWGNLGKQRNGWGAGSIVIFIDLCWSLGCDRLEGKHTLGLHPRR